MADIYTNVVLVPPTAEALTVDVVGQFYPASLSNSNPSNGLSIQFGHEILQFAQREYEAGHRNETGVKFHDSLLKTDLDRKFATRGEKSMGEGPASQWVMHG